MDCRTGRSPEEGRDLALFPLAVPSIAGPGAMMAVIVLTDNDVYTVPERLANRGVLLVGVFITLLPFLFFGAVFRGIGPPRAALPLPVMGLLLFFLAGGNVL